MLQAFSTLAMPVEIETTYTVSMDDGIAWKIARENVQTVEGIQYVKLKPYDPTFVRFVVGNEVELPKKSRPSLGKLFGFQELVRLRNAAVAAEAKTEDAAATSLFGEDTAETSSKRKPRLNAARLKELRDSPVAMEVGIPGADARPALSVSCLKPVHPNDDIWLQMDPDSLEHVVLFIRSQGIAVEDLLSKRAYRDADAPAGVWKNGKGSLVRKIRSDDQGDEGEAGDMPPKKWQTVRMQADAAENAAAVQDLDAGGHDESTDVVEVDEDA